MARITVEDCLKKVDNRFELTVLAGYRAKEISKGADLYIDKKDSDKNQDKSTVISLREISEKPELIGVLRKGYLSSLQSSGFADDILEDDTKNIEESTDKSWMITEKDGASKSIVEIEEELTESFIDVENYFEDEENKEDDQK